LSGKGRLRPFSGGGSARSIRERGKKKKKKQEKGFLTPGKRRGFP